MEMRAAGEPVASHGSRRMSGRRRRQCRRKICLKEARTSLLYRTVHRICSAFCIPHASARLCKSPACYETSHADTGGVVRNGQWTALKLLW